MAFDRAIQALSGIEEKLRRAFNLAGTIGSKLDPNVSAVILADDLRDPGHAFYRGRCWVWADTSTGSPAGVNGISLVALDDIMVDAITLSGQVTVNTLIEAYISTPDEPPAVAGATAGNFAWRDRKTVTLDVPPLAGGATWAAITGTLVSVNNRQHTWVGAVAAQLDSVREMKIMIPRGGALNFRSSAASANMRLGAYGRIWP